MPEAHELHSWSATVTVRPVTVRPAAGSADGGKRFPVLFVLATLAGVWFGVTAPHVSPVAPPPPSSPVALGTGLRQPA